MRRAEKSRIACPKSVPGLSDSGDRAGRRDATGGSVARPRSDGAQRFGAGSPAAKSRAQKGYRRSEFGVSPYEKHLRRPADRPGESAPRAFCTPDGEATPRTRTSCGPARTPAATTQPHQQLRGAHRPRGARAAIRLESGREFNRVAGLALAHPSSDPTVADRGHERPICGQMAPSASERGHPPQRAERKKATGGPSSGYRRTKSTFDALPTDLAGVHQEPSAPQMERRRPVLGPPVALRGPQRPRHSLINNPEVPTGHAALEQRSVWSQAVNSTGSPG
ncbi:hypothetical protein ENSA5_29660 [Enhygromyxa salina]|uniref:Uncharacterized protein n=1 Tax=Enhygromyxa salina TaxID=215803 RepID=A0A2S9Y1E6_9BACT|nr:hypothetical protein ENSA5_29660 [Enhygromyxa salina]